MDISNFELALRLVMAWILGGLIGMERESHGRPAGFRTHILVCVGATLMMLVSAFGLQSVATDRVGGHDPGRIAAQVVSGIGFLGAGTIMREGANIRGLTTAASLWTVAGIGLAVGAGFYFPSLVATLLVVVTLVVLNKVEWAFGRKQELIGIRTQDTPGQLARVFAVLAKHDINVYNVEMDTSSGGDAVLELSVEIPQKAKRMAVLDDLMATPGIFRASYR